jgi:hypothetical protein
MTAATLWMLLWCVDGCYNGVFTEGPKDWERQGFCVPGKCDIGAVCDAARRDILDKGMHARPRRKVQAFCAYDGD